MGAPQIIWIALYSASVAISYTRGVKEGNKTLIGAGIMAAICWWGGFFG